MPPFRYAAFCRQVKRRAFAARSRTVCLSVVTPLLVFIIFPTSLCAEPDPRRAELNPKTSEAFATYVKATDTRNSTELQRGAELLWIDSLPEAAQKKAYDALGRGEVEMEQRHTLINGKEAPCPDGLIHHWEGLIFVPGAKVSDVLRILQDYNHHSEYYAPDVARSKIESRDGDRFQVFMRFRRQKVVTVVLDTTHDITYYRDSPTLAHSRSTATHIAEVDNPDKPNEKEKSHYDDNGFMWGMETWWRFEEKDGGVYVQGEVVSLTREIPVGLGWMIGPFVTSIPKSSLTFTLEATKKAVLAQLGSANPK